MDVLDFQTRVFMQSLSQPWSLVKEERWASVSKCFILLFFEQFDESLNLLRCQFWCKELNDQTFGLLM